jgi:hypothetical protein
MHKYTHAWLAFKAIERLQKIELAANDRKHADSLVNWFKNRKDGIINGAWYPDSVIKDNATSHVLKFSPAGSGQRSFRSLPSTMRLFMIGKKSGLFNTAYTVDPDTNLQRRCEALSHAVIDILRVQQIEQKGSPVVPTDNHIALTLFMLSHYIADAHMPLHCDSRRFSEGADIHATIEGIWEDEVRKQFKIETANERFAYDPEGYPLLISGSAYLNSFLKKVEDEVTHRNFIADWGQENGNVMEYIEGVCQYSYLLAYSYIPRQYNDTNVTLKNWQNLPGQTPSFDELTVIVLSDAIDSISRIWLRLWRRYKEWQTNVDAG